jgi:hypothetical protein
MGDVGGLIEMEVGRDRDFGGIGGGMEGSVGGDLESTVEAGRCGFGVTGESGWVGSEGTVIGEIRRPPLSNVGESSGMGGREGFW